MALVVEDGSGRVDAESYVSAAEMDAYLDRLGDAATWRSKAPEEQEPLLRIGTRFIERAYGLRFLGLRVKNDQALAWPRYGVCDRDGRYVGSDEIPPALKRATFEAIRRALAGESLFSATVESGTVKSESVEAGSASVSTTYESGVRSTGDSEAERYPAIELEITPLLRRGGRIRRA